jgi:hypothetical protein
MGELDVCDDGAAVTMLIESGDQLTMLEYPKIHSLYPRWQRVLANAQQQSDCNVLAIGLNREHIMSPSTRVDALHCVDSALAYAAQPLILTSLLDARMSRQSVHLIGNSRYWMATRNGPIVQWCMDSSLRSVAVPLAIVQWHPHDVDNNNNNNIDDFDDDDWRFLAHSRVDGRAVLWQSVAVGDRQEERCVYNWREIGSTTHLPASAALVAAAREAIVGALVHGNRLARWRPLFSSLVELVALPPPALGDDAELLMFDNGTALVASVGAQRIVRIDAHRDATPLDMSVDGNFSSVTIDSGGDALLVDMLLDGGGTIRLDARGAAVTLPSSAATIVSTASDDDARVLASADGRLAGATVNAELDQFAVRGDVRAHCQLGASLLVGGQFRLPASANLARIDAVGAPSADERPPLLSNSAQPLNSLDAHTWRVTALHCLSDGDAALVALHDGARPHIGVATLAAGLGSVEHAADFSLVRGRIERIVDGPVALGSFQYRVASTGALRCNYLPLQLDGDDHSALALADDMNVASALCDDSTDAVRDALKNDDELLLLGSFGDAQGALRWRRRVGSLPLSAGLAALGDTVVGHLPVQPNVALIYGDFATPCARWALLDADTANVSCGALPTPPMSESLFSVVHYNASHWLLNGVTLYDVEYRSFSSARPSISCGTVHSVAPFHFAEGFTSLRHSASTPSLEIIALAAALAIIAALAALIAVLLYKLRQRHRQFDMIDAHHDEDVQDVQIDDAREPLDERDVSPWLDVADDLPDLDDVQF